MVNMNVILFTVLALWLTLASSYRLPKTKQPIPTKPFSLPREVQAQGHKIMPELRIPNEEFCRNMKLEPHRNYMILPWWTVYCERLLEKEEKTLDKTKKQIPIYGKILGMVQQYKKKQALKEALLSSF